MNYKIISYPSSGKRILFIPGWQSEIPIAFLNKLNDNFSIYVLLFKGAHYKSNDILNIEGFKKSYQDALIKIKPDIIIGHSFGGKIISYFPTQKPTYIIAPSCFKSPNITILKVKFKIFRNKLMKQISNTFNIPLKNKYLGSNDYKNSSGNLRKTFLNIKDEYPPLDNFKKFTNLKIYGYDNDKSIPLKLLQKKCKKLSLNLITLKGNHFTFFIENDFLIENIKNDLNNIYNN